MNFKTLDEAISFAEKHNLAAVGYRIIPTENGWKIIKDKEN